MPLFRRKTRRKIKKVFVLLLIVLILLGYAYFIEPNSLETKNQVIKLDCLKEDLKDKKFVQLSDFHFTGKTGNDKVNQIYDATVKANPAAVFLTGDYTSDKKGLPAVKDLVGKISVKFPVYAVFGNWDYYVYGRNMGEIQRALENSGAKVLINDGMTLKINGEEINLIGVKDPYTGKDTRSDLGEATRNIGKDDKKCKILLAHSPDVIKAAEEKNIDLVLAGHTHGGQIYIPYITEEFMPVNPDGKGFVRGLYKVNDTEMYVNQGIGLSLFPLRLGVPPEVTVIRLEK